MVTDKRKENYGIKTLINCPPSYIYKRSGLKNMKQKLNQRRHWLWSRGSGTIYFTLLPMDRLKFCIFNYLNKSWPFSALKNSKFFSSNPTTTSSEIFSCIYGFVSKRIKLSSNFNEIKVLSPRGSIT